MKSKAKINKLAHRYALDISKFHEKGVTKIDFNNLNKDFYDDIETNDLKIKSEKKLLNKIKGKTLKEFIYTNKIIPDSWKNKLDYQSEMTNLISKDKKLLSYIGSFPANYLYINKLPKININFDSNINNDNIESKTEKSRKIFKFKKNAFDNDDVKLMLDDYRAEYPIKERLQNLVNKYEINNKEFTKENDEINGEGLGSKEENNFSLLKKINPVNKRERTIIQRKFRHNIFSLDSLKYINSSNNNNYKTIWSNNMKKIQNKGGPNIKNLTIEKNVKSINYYGPHFSFCPSCKNKNIEFYNRMEPHQCIDLINHIKNFRKINSIYTKKYYTNSIISKNKRSASIPRLNLYNEKDSETSEEEENTYKVYF